MPSTQVVTSPSESDGGRAWLENFSSEDQPAARALIDSLRIIAEDELRTGLLNKLDELTAALPAPILILPVRDLNDFRRPGDSHLPVVYKTFSPFADFKPAPGSEVISANILRDIIGVRFKDPRFLNPASSLEDLRPESANSAVSSPCLGK